MLYATMPHRNVGSFHIPINILTVTIFVHNGTRAAFHLVFYYTRTILVESARGKVQGLRALHFSNLGSPGLTSLPACRGLEVRRLYLKTGNQNCFLLGVRK